MTIQEMKRRKTELGYSNEQLAALSGVPLGTIMKIFGGATKSPRRSTIAALEKVLAPVPGQAGGSTGLFSRHTVIYTDTSPQTAGMVRESSFEYGSTPRMKQDEVDPRYLQLPHSLATVDDYYALPDDIRTELIDGIFYDMASPSVTHQLIIGELHLQFKACEKKHGGKCRVILSPCDVQLDRDQYTMVQPDILVVCDPQKIKGRNCFGVPDLVVEILSPSSRSHDCVLKLRKYKNSGVREYWIVDPEHRQVITYYFGSNGDEDSPQFETYLFTDTIPIRISGGECSVDMNEVLSGIV